MIKTIIFVILFTLISCKKEKELKELNHFNLQNKIVERDNSNSDLDNKLLLIDFKVLDTLTRKEIYLNEIKTCDSLLKINPKCSCEKYININKEILKGKDDGSLDMNEIFFKVYYRYRTLAIEEVTGKEYIEQDTVYFNKYLERSF